jgi:transcriptional regulator with XRE-family HTH domain
MAEDMLGRYCIILDEFLRLRGLMRRPVERKLGWSKGTLTKLLAGTNELRVRQLLEILEAIEVPPMMFFSRVYAEHDVSSALLQQMLRALEEDSAPPARVLPTNLTDEELDTRIESVVQRILNSRTAKPD